VRTGDHSKGRPVAQMTLGWGRRRVVWTRPRHVFPVEMVKVNETALDVAGRLAGAG